MRAMAATPHSPPFCWSPPASLPPGCRTFSDALRAVRCRVLLLYGADDEWCATYMRDLHQTYSPMTSGAP